MQTKEFFHKLASRHLWLNLLAMLLLIVVLAIATHVGLNLYTHHGESITVPDVSRQSLDAAKRALESRGFKVEINDTGFVKTLPAGIILSQLPAGGSHLKAGRVIYLTINSANSPTLSLPDIIDNSSLREAQAKLTAMGFQLTAPKEVPGEKDWVYGIQAGGRSYTTGQRIPVDTPVTILVGNGHIADDEDIVMTDAPADETLYGDEEVTETEESSTGSSAAPQSSEEDDFTVVE